MTGHPEAVGFSEKSRKKCSNGKSNPVTLVATVLARKTAVQMSSRFAAISPNTTTNPEKILTKLNTTCTKVNVVIPKITTRSFFSLDPYRLCLRRLCAWLLHDAKRSPSAASRATSGSTAMRFCQTPSGNRDRIRS